MVCQEQRFCSILTGTFLWNPMPETDKSIVIAEIGCREKILSERIPLNGQWNNRTSQTWPEKGHGREGRSRTSFFFFTKLTKSNDRAKLKSTCFYRTGGHFTRLVHLYFVFTRVSGIS
jgi:hypothetical protein